MKSILPTFLLLCLAIAIHAQNPNNTLRGKVLYQSSGNKPAVGVRVAEPDATAVFSVDNGDYLLKFQNKRNGATLSLEIGKDDGKNQKLELVNEKEVKGAKLPASMEEVLDIIVCPAGQRDIAAQKYYRILRTTADRELEKKKKEVESLLAQKEKDYQKISDLFAQLDGMQAALDSAKIREQAFNIASINLDRASQLVKDAVKKIEEENDVEGALKILSLEALDTAYQLANAIKRQSETMIKKADVGIQQVVEGYEFKISLLQPKFKYSEIAECYEKIAGIYEKENYDKDQKAINLAWAAEYWRLEGKYQKALGFNIKVLNIREQIFPIDSQQLATGYNNIAVVYRELGDYQKALEFNLKALSILEKILPTNNSNLITSYNNLALLNTSLRDKEKAMAFIFKALTISEKYLSKDHPDLASVYSSQSFVYGSFGEERKALESELKGLEIREKVLPANHPDLARSYNNLAVTYSNLGESEKALQFILKALNIFEKVLYEYHPDLATSYSTLGGFYSSTGEYQKGLESNLKALAIREKILPKNHPDLAKSYNGVAVAYFNLDEHQKALEFFLKALVIQEIEQPKNHPELAKSYSDIALTYFNLGKHQKALEFNLKALVIRKKTLPAIHLDLATSYSNLAVVYGSISEYHKQLEFNLKALTIYEKILPAESYKLASSYSNLAFTYGNLRKYKKELEFNLKALSIYGKILPENHPELATSFNNIGLCYAKLHQFPQANECFEKFQKINSTGRAFRNWAMYYALQNDKTKAIENLQKAISLGYNDLNWIENDDSLESIRGEQGYKDIVEQLKRQ